MSTKDAKAKKFASKWFRVATEGATVDGRSISRLHIEQMARNFNPDKYGARIWVEHYRGLAPDSQFGALGDVKALKAEEVDGKMRLFAQIEPLPRLIEINKAGQKIYTSIELDPRFADTGEAYMVGLAVTDTPASVGTEALKFTVGTKRPDDFKAHLFSAAEEASIEFEEVADEADNKTVGAFTAALEKFAALMSGKPEQKPDPKPEAKPAGTVDMAAFAAGFADLNKALTEQAEATTQALQKLTTASAEQGRAILELKGKLAKLDAEPAQGQQFRRNPGPGGANEVTDC
ncbi:GPO family capsid scaffolding protein [Hydrogenophaga electricum]|nr:GPO family capsid scaffolding protein [Hydrogenophaga electricum]